MTVAVAGTSGGRITQASAATGAQIVQLSGLLLAALLIRAVYVRLPGYHDDIVLALHSADRSRPKSVRLRFAEGAVMFALLIAADVAAPTPAATCAAADPAVTSLTSQLFKKRGNDHYVITATLTNLGAQSQTPDITQRVELVRDGTVSAPQTVPALGAGVAYKLAFAVDRAAGERAQPLTVTVRYVLTSGDPARNACNRSNDEITQTF